MSETTLARRGADALRRLLVVAAAVVLLGHGGLEVGPRLAVAAASAAQPAGPSTASRAPAPRTGAEQEPAPGSLLRAVGAVVTPTGGESAGRPGASLSVAPHLVARPVARPPSTSYALEVGGGASGRAPPVPAGT